MDGNAVLKGGQHHFRMENMYLRQEIVGLEQQIGILERSIVTQQKEIGNLQKGIDDSENRTGWDKLNDSLLTLGEHRIDDAIELLVKKRDLYRERVRLSAAKSGHSQVDASGTITAFPTDQQQQRASNHAHGIPRSATTLNISSVKTIVKQKSQQSLKRVGSAFGLAARFALLFMKDRNYKGKEWAKDSTIIEDDEERAVRDWEEFKIRERDAHDARLIAEQRTCPLVLNPKATTGTHPNAMSWKLQQAQEEYKKSLEKEAASFTASTHSFSTVERRPSTTKESREVEEELVEAMEKELLASFPRNKGLIRTMNWPEGSREDEDEDVFNSTPRRRSAPVQELQAQTQSTGPLSRTLSVQEPQSQLRSARGRSTQTLSTTAQAQAASPPQSIPHPRIPRQNGPVQARTRQNCPPPPPPTQDDDDVFRFARAKTPPTQKTPAALLPRTHRSRKRCSEPSPTPRFVSFRPVSPSPGGNAAMPPNPVPSWLRTSNRRNGVVGRSVDGETP